MNYLSRSRTPRLFPGQPAHAGRLLRSPRQLIDALITSALPQRCSLCEAYAGRWPVCAGCEAKLPRPPERCCPRCANVSEAGDVCARCLTNPLELDATVAAFRYAEPIDHLIHALKYGHQLHLAAWFGARLADRFPDPAAVGPCLLIALPLHPDRLRDRGFNQATEIARPLARRLGAPLHHDLCRRVRATRPQASLELAERRSNVEQAFECGADLTGQTVIVVDDVMTSGASIGELARTLRLHGARRVVAAVAARTLHT